MQKLNRALQILVGILITAGLAWGGVVAARAVWRLLATLPKDVATTLFGISCTVAGSIVTLLLSKRAERRREIEFELRKQKVPVYEKLLSFIFRFIYEEKTGRGSPSTEETIQFFSEFTPQMIIWGSDDVVAEFTAFRDAANGGDVRKVALAVERVMFAIRRDVGHANKRLGEGKLLGTFVNDIRSFLATNHS